MEDILTKDDWELTLKELKGQRVQLKIQIEVVQASILHCESCIAYYNKNEEFKAKQEKNRSS